MGNSTVTAITIIIPIKVTFLHRLKRKMHSNGCNNIAKYRQIATNNHGSIFIKKCSIKIFLLADEGGHGRAFQQRFHLCLCGAGGSTDHLKGHHITALHGHSLRA